MRTDTWVNPDGFVKYKFSILHAMTFNQTISKLKLVISIHDTYAHSVYYIHVYITNILSFGYELISRYESIICIL